MNTLRTRGVSLIELMVALTIGSFLIIGAVTVYVQSRNTYSINEAVARLQENARFAMSTIEPDLRLANYWGLMNDAQLIAGTIGNAPLPGSPSSCGPDFAIDLRRPIEGVNNDYTLTCSPGPAGNAQDNADTVVVRRADTPAVAADANRLQVYTTRQGGSSRVFRSATPPGSLAVDPVYGPSAEVHNLIVRAYYVSQDSSSRPGLPSLRRQTLVGGPGFQDEEIMPGVEDLQVQFGIDPGADGNGDGVPDDNDGNGMPDRYNGIASRYVNPGDPALATGLVVAVRIWIRVRAESPEVGFNNTQPFNYADVVNFVPNDNYRRLLVSRTIQIRNTVSLQT